MDQKTAVLNSRDPAILAQLEQRIRLLIKKHEERKNNHEEPILAEELKGWDLRAERFAAIQTHHQLKSMNGQRLEKLRAALERIQDGTYAICQNPDCGKIIPFLRLDAIPEAKYCVRCYAQNNTKRR